MHIAGIDEAGRGPVIGPMVMAIVAVLPEEEKKLKQMGVKDSKLLTAEQREKLAVKLQEKYEYEIISLTPEDIDTAVNGKNRGDNLNRLEVRTSALLILTIAKDVPLTKVIIDSPERDTQKYERLIRQALNEMDKEGITKQIELQCEIKADLNHVVVGAASILAKVARDAAIRVLEAEHGPMGSGYLTDPKTQEFLDRTWKDGHSFFRKSWASFQRLVEKANQSSLIDFAKEQRAEHKEEIEAFEQLRAHGFLFKEPTNQYEIIRMQHPESKVTIIKYTTGKLVVQGPDGEKKKTENLLLTAGLLPK